MFAFAQSQRTSMSWRPYRLMCSWWALVTSDVMVFVTEPAASRRVRPRVGASPDPRSGASRSTATNANCWISRTCGRDPVQITAASETVAGETICRTRSRC